METHKQDDHMESFFLAETVSISTENAAAKFSFADMMLVWNIHWGTQDQLDYILTERQLY